MSAIKDGVMPVIYIAGKYRDVNSWQVEENARRAERIALDVAMSGFVPLCPHAMYRHYDGTMSDQFWIDATMALMRRCDAVVIAGSDWLTSEGTRGEIAEAERLGISVYYSVEQLIHGALAQGWI